MRTFPHRKIPTIFMLILSSLFLSMPTISRAQSGGSCTGTTSSASSIVLDGQFGDWAGQPCIPDPVADCSNDRADLAGFWFTTVPNNPTAYFMAQTVAGANQPLGLRLNIDTNNDGIYTSAVDRIVTIRYQASQNDSEVEIDLLDGGGEKVAEIVRGADWGASRSEGGNLVEWGISLASLGIQTGQPIRMFLESRGGSPNGNGNWCDTTQAVQWSPADALGLVILFVLIVAIALLAARMQRRLT